MQTKPLTLTPGQIEKLIKIAGMLGSPHSGEAANAAHICTKIIIGASTTWNAVMTAAIKSLMQESIKEKTQRYESAENENENPYWMKDWKKIVGECLTCPEIFTAWEQDFLEGLRRWQHLSPKQKLILIKLYQKFNENNSDY